MNMEQYDKKCETCTWFAPTPKGVVGICRYLQEVVKPLEKCLLNDKIETND
jgi:hypothetical protein